jgi:hypothetical protein
MMIRRKHGLGKLGDCVPAAYTNTPGQPGYFSSIPTGQIIPATCQEYTCTPGATVSPLMLSANHDPAFIATITATGYVPDGQGGYICPQVPKNQNPVYPVSSPQQITATTQQVSNISLPPAIAPTAYAPVTVTLPSQTDTSTSSTLSSIPWYVWLGGAAALYYAFASKG